MPPKPLKVVVHEPSNGPASSVATGALTGARKKEVWPIAGHKTIVVESSPEVAG